LPDQPVRVRFDPDARGPAPRITVRDLQAATCADSGKTTLS